MKLSIPKPSQKNANDIALIDCVPRRRTEAVIKAELEDIHMRQMHYRPAYVKPISTEDEKERLSQMCEYKGGKALPAELIAPPRDTPLEMQQKKKEKDRLAAIQMKRSGAVHQTRQAVPLSATEQLAEQISSEIDERRQHLEEMYVLGISPTDEARIKAEISIRVAELQKLDQG